VLCAVQNDEDGFRHCHERHDRKAAEDFPILVPTGVVLVGDEVNNGNGSAAVFINGEGDVGIQVSDPAAATHAAIVPGAARRLRVSR